MEIKKTLYMNQLFSYYQNLLTDRQKQYMADYYEEDYTLQEIAENYQISRQAVYDSLRRTEKALLNYEKQMQLVQNSEERYASLKELKEYIMTYYADDLKLQSMVDQLLEIEM